MTYNDNIRLGNRRVTPYNIGHTIILKDNSLLTILSKVSIK